MPPIIALSTCWNSCRHQDGYAMLQEISSLGFQYVELSHGIRVSLVPGILKAVDEGIIKVSSLHNFCPLPPGVTGAAPNLYRPSSWNKTERALWRRYTQGTFDLANRVGAQFVVMHLGSIQFIWSNPVKKLKALAGDKSFSELKEDVPFQIFFKKVYSKVQKKALKVLISIQSELVSLLELPQNQNIIVAVENRDGLLELPLDNQLAQFVADFPLPGRVGCWHDTGHARTKESWGLLEHQPFLEAQKDHLIGFHLKDWSSEEDDNMPLGRGLIDFQMLRKYFKPNATFVVEVGPSVSPKAILESKTYLERLLLQ